MRETRFKKIAWAVLVLVYLVIVAGSVVRTTGSGMGCPDWPKCFGQWIPPTDESQLPENYREDFTKQRLEKAERFADMLASIGFKKDAEKLRSSERVLQKEEPFNASKTWTEYLNRLVGFLAGNLMLLQAILSIIWFRKTRRRIMYLSILNTVLIGFQAWLGSMVVATNLVPWVISVHMFVALLIVWLQIVVIRRMGKREATISGTGFLAVLLTCLAISIAQILLGSQLRQEVDVLMASFGRSGVVDNLGAKFEWHRSFAWVVLVANIGLIYIGWKHGSISKQMKYLGGIILAEILFGVLLVYADFPALAQPIHLTLACLMFGVQAFMLSRLFDNNKALGS